MQASMICKYFARGYCRKSTTCTYSHVLSSSNNGSTRSISISAQRHQQKSEVCFPLKIMECKHNTAIHEGTMQTVGTYNRLKKLNETDGSCKGTNFSLMTWNVLADSYINYSFYPYCPYPALKWPYRRNLILNAIQDKTPDIICMQELEDYAWFKNNLERLGYKGLFKQRTRDRTDGCAIFYQDHKFKVVRTEAIELNKFTHNDPDMQKLDEFFRGYSRGLATDRNKKDCIALFAMLQPIDASTNNNANVSSDESASSDSESSSTDVNSHVNNNTNTNQNNFYGALYGNKKRATTAADNTNANLKEQIRADKPRARSSSVAEQICIATTHIYWNPKYVDVKMKQIKQVLLQLSKFNPSLRNTILCGDFNSTPTSGLYQFVRNGNLDLSLYTPDELDERATARNILKNNAGVKIDQSEIGVGGLKRKPSQEIEGLPRKRIHLLDSDEDDSVENQSNSDYNSSNEENSSNDQMVIRHPFKFRSAYEEYNTEDLSEPYFTSYFKVFKGTVDYIFYTEDLARTHVVELPGPDLLKQLGGVPHYQWPSDHLALSSYFTTQKPVTEMIIEDDAK